MSLSEVFKKIFAGQTARAGEAGQAVLEYILVLFVSVSIILGALYQFNDAFKQFLDNYFGDYIACLLETGELPSLGGDGPTQEECNRGFSNFKIASGRPAKEGSGEGSGSNPTAAGAGSSSDSDSSSSGGGRPARFNTGGNSPNGEGFPKSDTQRPARQRLNTAGNTDLDSSAAESGDDPGFSSKRRRRRKRRYKTTIPEEFLTRNARKKRGEKLIIVKKTKEQRRLSSLSKAKFTVSAPEKKPASIDLGEGGFSFAKILKFLIIAGILVAIFIFLGGQALQIKKSWQKGE